MKIALLATISHPLPPRAYAPLEKDVHLMAKEMTKLGADVTVFLAADSKDLPYKTFYTVDKSLENLTEFHYMQECVHINKALREITTGGYDIVNNHLNWNGMLALDSIIDCNHVTTLHGFEPHSLHVFNRYKDRKYISISDAERNEAPDLNYVGTIYNPIDFEFHELVETKKDYLFIAARIFRGKGFHNAIKLAKATGTKLIMAGRIIDQEYFDTEMAPHIDGDQIQYLGMVSQEEMKRLSGEAKAYISLLEWEEPFGLSVAEAIACGTPIIANKRGSMPELVKDGVSGLLVDTVEEAIQRFNEVNTIDSKLCREHGRNLFSAEKVASEYIKLFQKLLK
jgi:glycosyltransferase involved in cell wall biosynthesis